MACPSDPNCTLAWVTTNISACAGQTTDVCVTMVQSPPPPKVVVSPSGGFAYGAILSIVCDVFIAIGLGLQKTGHMRVMKKPEAERKAVYHQPVWVLGLVCMISGEVGNLLAYGDDNTPTAVVTSVGCIGVVANLFIATIFLKEPFRFRDVVGAVFVVAGVVLVTLFAPTNPDPLTGDQLNSFLVQGGAIAIYIVYGGAIVILLCFIKRIGHKNVVWYLLLSSLIGAFTVMASKPVSTFLMLSIEGLSKGQYNSELQPQILTAQECAATNGFGAGTSWQPIVGVDTLLLNQTHGCVFEGLGQFGQPTFWIAIVVLAVTAVSQVKYLNDALGLFSNSEVIPVHYTLFTICSMTGSIIMYQEYHIRESGGCIQWWTLHLFVDGIAATFLGVYFITTRRIVVDLDNPDSVKEAMQALEQDPSSASIDFQPGHDHDVGAHDTVQLVLGGEVQAPPPPASSFDDDEPEKAPRLNDSLARNDPPASAEGVPVVGTSLGGLKLSRERSRQIMMGERSGSALRQSYNGTKPSSRLSTAVHANGNDSGDGHADEAASPRVSIVDNVVEAVGSTIPKFPAGFDARPNDRTSRAASVVNFLGALTGGQQAAFLYDPEDKRTKDSKAAARAAARASAADAAHDHWIPTWASFARNSSASPRDVNATHTGQSKCPTSGSPRTTRMRAQSSPQQYTGNSTPPGGQSRLSALPGINEGGSIVHDIKHASTSFDRSNRASSGNL